MKTSSIKLTTKDIAYCAVFAAIMCILGPMSIPIGTIPMSFTNFVIYISVFVLGKRKTVISYFIYIIIGLFGLPVFSGYTGGPGKFFGPTGGYLIGFLFMAIICGYFAEKYEGKSIVTICGMILGMAVDYIFGTAWFVFLTKTNAAYALAVCVVPFIVFDVIKIVIASFVGPMIKIRIK